MYKFTLFFVIPFLLITTYISYLLCGDFSYVYYKMFGFAYTKVLQMAFRGSLDNADFDLNLNRNTFDEMRIGPIQM
jgi:hypothetical protein